MAWAGDSSGDLLIADKGNNRIREVVFGAPFVAMISPNSGPLAGGTTVTITGFNFSNATKVSFGNTPASSFTIISPTQITAVSPSSVNRKTVDVTVSNQYSTSSTSQSDQFTYFVANGLYHPITPTRIVDTRASSGNNYQLAGKTFSPGQTQNVTVVNSNSDNLPSNASAVVANVTVTNTTQVGGFLTIWPTGSPIPNTSFINFGINTTKANLITVQVGVNGQISVYNYNGSTDVIIDIEGYYGPSNSATEGLFNPITPTRLADTRASSGNIYQLAGKTFSPNEIQTVQILGKRNVPATGVSAAILNVTAVNATGAGDFLTIYRGGNTPNASNLNFMQGQTIPNSVIVPVSSTGTISIYFFSGSTNGSTDVIVDVLGYFTNSNSSTGYPFNPVVPFRVCDTRGTNSTECSNKTMSSNSYMTIGIANNASGDGLPSMSSSTPVLGVVANVTVTNTTANGGFLTVNPSGLTPPSSSNLNWSAFQTVANGIDIGVDPNGTITAYNFTGAADIIVDIVGWFR